VEAVSFGFWRVLGILGRSVAGRDRKFEEGLPPSVAKGGQFVELYSCRFFAGDAGGVASGERSSSHAAV
jgi:hypothetical protein